MKVRKKINFTFGDFIIYFILVMTLIVTLYPILNVFAVSLSKYSTVLMHPFMVIPRDLDFTSYQWVLSHPLIWTTYKNTIIVTVASVVLSMFLISTYAYPLATEGFRGKKIFTSILVFTMFFNGGLIPNFYLVQSIGIYNTLWALIIPASMSAYNTILMINFIRAIPPSLKEAARIDGANEMFVFTRIVLPLSKPIIATLSLFVAVTRWNSFFSAIIYIRDQGLWTLQLLLREILFSTENFLDDTSSMNLPVQGMKYAVIIVAVVPILCVYPFIQKYFAKGIMLGAVKG